MAFMYKTIVRLTAVFLILAILSLPVASSASLRVVSLYAAHTENAVALGAADFLVGVSTHDDPAFLPKLPRVPLKAGAESFLVLNPDIVLTRSFSVSQNPHLYKVLKEAGVRIAVIDPPTWDNFPDYLRELAVLLGVNPSGAVELFNKTAEQITKEAVARSRGKKRPLVFVESTSKSLRTCAGESWAASLIELAGGKNAAAGAKPISEGSAVAAWGLERTLRTIKSRLDVYVVQQGAMNSSGVEDVRARPWAASLKEIKVAVVPEAYLSRPSLPGLTKGGQMLIDIFYGKTER